MAAKEFIVVGGPNGAGKTTFVEEYLSHHDILYLAADHLAKVINPAAPELVAVAAGRQFVEHISASLSGGESFIVETTLSGKTFRRTLQRAREHGFTITIHFVFNDGPDTSVARVLERVRRGGHNVPEEDIRRRYRRSLVNFWQI